MGESVKEFYEQFKKDQGRMQAAAPDLMKGFGTFYQAVTRKGALETKQKELVAVGIALAQSCEACIYLHVKKALGAGATRDEVLEAAAVGVMMQGGPAYTHFPYVLDALEANDA